MPLGGGLIAASAIMGVVQGGAQLYSGLHKLKKDKEELAKLKTPYYKVQDEYYQNKNLANEMAQGGMGAATRDYATTQGERGLGAGISGILSAGGDPSDISHLFDSYDRSIDRISAQDAQAHLDNIKYFTQANKDLAGQKTTQWGINEYKPYNDKLSELTARKAADEKTAWNGASGIISGIGNVGTGLSNQKLLGSMTAKNNAQADLFSSLFSSGTQGGMHDPFELPSQSNMLHSDASTADAHGDNPSYEELLQMFNTFRKR
jgi:hypothetical protein